MEQVKYCEYCAEELTSEGRCPNEDCVYNVYIDAIAECDAEIEKENNERFMYNICRICGNH